MPGFGDAGFGPASPLKTAWDYYRKAFLAVLEGMREKGFPAISTEDYMEKALNRGGIFFAETRRSRQIRKSPPEKKWRHWPNRKTDSQTTQAQSEQELILITYTLPFHRPFDSATNSWLLEILPENSLLLNTKDAMKFNIKHGDSITVEAITGNGRIQTKAKIVPGIRPGVWHWQLASDTNNQVHPHRL